MAKRLFLITILFLTLGLPARATQPGNSTGAGIPVSVAKQLYGEIIAINAAEILLHTAGGDYRFKLAKGVQFYCNGMPAAWRALRPVYADAYFEAFVDFNDQKEVNAVRGFYNGQECLIEDWVAQREGLRLKLTTVEGERYLECPLAPGARLPQQKNWLETGATVFVLFNYAGGARGIYLVN